jgi:intein-encoded DNA endonuclease-like protein
MYKNKEWLEQKLFEYGSGSMVAKIEGYPVTCVNRYIRKYNLQNKRIGVAKRKYTLNHHYFGEIDTEEKAYWLGFLYADGCVYHNKTSYDVQIMLGIKDFTHLEKFKKAINSDYETKIVQKNYGPEAFFRCSSKKMYQDLLCLGCSPRKTNVITFPNIPIKLMPHFIRGYFDGDGSFYKSTKNYISCAFVITSGSKDFIDELYKYFVETLDIKLCVVYQNNSYSIKTTSKEKCYKIYTHLYDQPTIYLDRKNNLIQEFLEEYRSTIQVIV